MKIKIIAVALACFISTQIAAPAKTTSEDLKKIDDLKKSIKTRDSFWSQKQLGELYQKLNRPDDAIASYRRAATLASSGSDFMHLIWSWESMLQQRSLDPNVHIALAEAFLKSRNSKLLLWDAEVHCKRAIALSPRQQNATAERLLVEAETLRKTTRLPKPDTRIESFREQVAKKWSPPPITGLALARVQVAVNKSLQLKNMQLICKSGNAQFDKSAMEAVKSAPFVQLSGFQAPGLFDFAFVQDGELKRVSYLSYGSVVVP